MVQKILTDTSIPSLPNGYHWDSSLPSFGIYVGPRSRTFVLVKTGRRQKLGHYPNMSLKEARRRAHGLLAKPTSNLPVTLAQDVLDEYLSSITVREKTKTEYERLLKRLKLRGNLNTITPDQIFSKLDHYKTSEARHMYFAVSAFFSWCTARRYMQQNLLLSVRCPYKVTTRTHTPTDEEVAAIWKSAPDNDYGMIVKLFLAALKRDTLPKEERHLSIIFADEASHIFNHQTTRILTECRKYGLGFMAATQLIEQIPTEVKAAIYGSTAIKFAGAVSHTDAMLLAREMHTSHEMLRGLKSYEGSHAEWGLYVQNLTPHALKVPISFGQLEALPITTTIKPRAKKTCPFKVGDIIQVTLGDVDQFPDGSCVTQIEEEHEILFVEGSQTGIFWKDCRPFTPKPQKPPRKKIQPT